MPAHSQHAFSEKVSLVTNASNPFGRAVAMQLALYGSFVIAGYPPVDGDESALQELKSLGTLANAVKTDVSKVDEAGKLILAVERQFGRLDLLVNCPGKRPGSTFWTTDGEDFDRIVGSNLKSAFFVTREATRLMESRPKPRIVNILSACDSEEATADIAFSSSNAAIVGLTKSLSGTLPGNFRINAVSVSEQERAPTDAQGLDKDLFRAQCSVDPDDVARTVLFLLSSEAKGINGQVLKVE
jgi:NAD(P)-dependent dehydrogenase (short-subunit alcohol dehydrogenase family)